jgi:hypothetical protein
VWFKDTSAQGLAKTASAILGEIPPREGVPISPDQLLSAGMAKRVTTFVILDISCIDIAQPFLMPKVRAMDRVVKRVSGGVSIL